MSIEQKTDLEAFLESEFCDDEVRAYRQEKPIDFLFGLISNNLGGIGKVIKHHDEVINHNAANVAKLIKELMDRIEKLEIKTNQ